MAKLFLKIAGVAQLVEHRPSKPSVAGPSPVSRFFYFSHRFTTENTDLYLFHHKIFLFSQYEIATPAFGGLAMTGWGIRNKTIHTFSQYEIATPAFGGLAMTGFIKYLPKIYGNLGILYLIFLNICCKI